MKQVSIEKYAKILNAPYNKSHRHPWMKAEMRAAQFAPFSALTGHEEAIRKVCQYLEAQKRPGEDELEILKRRLDLLKEIIDQHPLIKICFVDENSPSQPVQLTARVKKLDEYNRTIVLNNGHIIPFSCILAIELEQK